MNDIMKIINFLEESSLLIKGVSKTIKSEARFYVTLLGTLGVSLLGTIKGTIRAGEDPIRAGQEFSGRLIL